MEAQPIQTSFLQGIFPIYVIIFIIITLLKVLYPNRFFEYINLLVNNRYIIVYEKKDKKTPLFTLSLTLIQWLSLSLFFYLWIHYHKKHLPHITPFIFIDIALILLLSLSLKYLLQRIISYIFELQDFGNHYLFSRLSYSNYASIVMTLLLFITSYSLSINEIYLYGILFIYLIINILSWIMIIKTNQRQVKQYLIYFILYLCTLEIAPYLYFYYAVKLM